ncbi:LON peptidase substrate-binding domain-containing protein [Gordonia phosphorivorans]|uniref:LON peptidase substrate-binding domain-containing protein n=2 Tax=Gordonia TaxID=2053 RepID=A0ABP8Z3W4_9ACTN
MPVLPMFPLEHALLPGEPLQLNVFEPRYRALVADVVAGDGRFGVVLIARGSEVGGGDDRCDVGTVTGLLGHRSHASGQIRLACRGLDRIRVTRWLDDDPYPRAEVQMWPDEPAGTTADWQWARSALTDALVQAQELYDRIAERSGRPTATLAAPEDLPPTEYTFRTAAMLPLGAADRYAILTARGPRERVAAMTRALDDVLPLLRDRLTPPTAPPNSP